MIYDDRTIELSCLKNFGVSSTTTVKRKPQLRFYVLYSVHGTYYVGTICDGRINHVTHWHVLGEKKGLICLRHLHASTAVVEFDVKNGVLHTRLK